MSGRPTVLCLAVNFPWPADSGGTIRVAGLLQEMSRHYDLRLLVPRGRDSAATAALVLSVRDRYGIVVETFDEPVYDRRPAAAAALWLRSFAHRMPPWVYCLYDPRLLARFRELLPTVDAVVLLQDMSGLYPLLARAELAVPVVADKHVVMARPRSDSDLASLRTRLLRLLTVSFERRYLATAARIVVTTDEDGRWLREIHGRQADAVIPTGVDIGPAQVGRVAGRRTVGWLSALDVVDNLEGLRRFLATAWPALAAEGYRLLVVGRNPAPEVAAMTSVPGVTLLGHVEDLAEFLAEVDVGVIPLWSGRGIKVKTLTFMAAGVPVVATPMAVEGMAVEDGREVLVGGTPEELADGVRRVLLDGELADALGAAGQQFVADRFTWPAVGAEFAAVVDAAIGPPRA